ncbi:MAG: alanine--tRNA ligase [Phycisphaerales bacterium]|nr:alanine--tRNA ligase [Phycisphaerales bacterium]
MPTASEIRQQYIDFFHDKCAHTVVPSSPVVPHDDPTLLFTNAGMNQFKPYFLGTEKPPYPRAVDTQKCIRAGGKHNDLEDVGKDTYHHTFFEMLGNWSFGDYFKAEAIEWAWTLLTDVWRLDPSRLYVTVFAGDPDDGLDADDEAEEIWSRFVPRERISRWGKKDNFWEMGDTGPCGPCSEIHFDSRPDEEREARSGADFVNRDHPDVIEIWNLVFIQFNRSESALTPLPAKHVDTGMGLERVTRVLQGKRSNYDTDLWTPIFDAIRTRTGARPYAGGLDDAVDIAYRVIADHLRCLTVAITDGATPGNDGRGYVLRRILRRAVRMANQALGMREPVLADLVPAVVDSLGDAFPELRTHATRVAGIIRDEEHGFLRTLDRGIELFILAADRAVKDGSTAISGDDAFKLHDTFGFPIDLTQVMAAERGMSVDLADYEQRMEQARDASRKTPTGPGAVSLDLPPDAIARLKFMKAMPTGDEDKYHGRPTSASIRAIWNGTDFVERLVSAGRLERVAIITDRTNFYAEQGGQVGDVGIIRDLDADRSEFHVDDTLASGGYVLHIGRLRSGGLSVDDSVTLTIDHDRRQAIRANHTATHLLNHALRQVVGAEVDQKGSHVDADRLRFDFASPRALDDSEINGVERLVNLAIHQDLGVHARAVPLEHAKAVSGVRAVFGERYPDPVRVVSIGAPVEDLLADPTSERWAEHAIEFCGGTHLASSGEAKKFIIVQETALAAGVRRIFAITGAAALAADAAGKELESRAFHAAQLDDEALVVEFAEITHLVDELTIGAVAKHRVGQLLDKLRERTKRIRKAAAAEARNTVVDQARVLAEGINGRVIVDRILGADKETLRAAMDVIRAKRPDVAAMLLSGDPEESKVAIIAAVPDELVRKGLKAGDWVRQAATICGGGGGGRPEHAEAGGRNIEAIDDAIRAAHDFAENALA